MSLLKNTEWITVKNKELELSESEMKFIYSTFRPLLDQAPSESHFVLSIFENSKIIKGVLTINSEYEKFSSETHASNIYRMCTELEKDINSKLTFWRKSRRLSQVGT